MIVINGPKKSRFASSSYYYENNFDDSINDPDLE